MRTAVLIDIDDCIINNLRRKKAILEYILNRRVKYKDIIGKRIVETLSLYLPKEKVPEFNRKFWEIALCVEEIGRNFLHLDKAEPYSRKVIKKLSNKFEIIYITNRLERMKEDTTLSLKRLGFPNYEMNFHADDHTFYERENARRNVLSKLPKEYEYVFVVDDIPENFKAYLEFGISNILGFMKYVETDENKYYLNGAKLVFKSWKDFPLTIYF